MMAKTPTNYNSILKTGCSSLEVGITSIQITAVSKFLNDVRTSMPATFRFRRLTLSSSNNLTLDRRCDPIKEECEIVEVGARGEFIVKLKSPAREVIIEGVVIFLSYCASEDRAADWSSVSFRPLNIVCAAHNNIVYSVKTDTGKFFMSCCKF